MKANALFDASSMEASPLVKTLRKFETTRVSLGSGKPGTGEIGRISFE